MDIEELFIGLREAEIEPKKLSEVLADYLCKNRSVYNLKEFYDIEYIHGFKEILDHESNSSNIKKAAEEETV